MPDMTVMVTGGCGYVGSKLVPALLGEGYWVRVFDALFFGMNFSPEILESPRLEIIQGDIRNRDAVKKALEGVEAVIHLAALANDPSAELNEDLTRQINRDAVIHTLEDARAAGVSRFINASTATVYGVREEPDVNETFEHRPITLYGEYKSETDLLVREANSSTFTTTSLRAATVCGWSPRMRLDLTVNILTHQAVCNGKITVFGGEQMRPNIVIDDLVRAYLLLVSAPQEKIGGEAYNIGIENHKVIEIARLIESGLEQAVQVVVEPVFDNRSYHISSAKIRRELGFLPSHSLLDGARQVRNAIVGGFIPNPENSKYRNVQHMKALIQRGVCH
jgi:nucleoside-diphosphate-sugar epimerase